MFKIHKDHSGFSASGKTAFALFATHLSMVAVGIYATVKHGAIPGIKKAIAYYKKT